MNYHSKTIENSLKELNSNFEGLSNFEAKKRREKYGENALPKAKKMGFFKRFLMQFKDIMVIILLIAAVVSTIVSLINKDYSDLFEGGVIFFIVVLNAIIGVIQESKAEDALESLQQSTEPVCKVLRDGVVKKIKNSELTLGDVVLLETGDIVPADLRLIETYNLKCDESTLTGESLSSSKNADVVFNEKTALADRKNMAYSSTIVTFGRASGLVVATGKDTEIGKIANMLSEGKKDLTPLEKSIKKVGKTISITVLSIAVVIFLIEIFFADAVNVLNAFLVSVTLAVAAIPESLPAVITIIMAMGLQNLAKKGAIVKRLKAVETLGSCEIICSDKTGTLTQNKMNVVNFSCNLQIFKDVQNRCEEVNLLTTAMALCNDSVMSENNKLVGDPTETALIDFNIKNKINDNIQNDYARIYEIGFDSDRKLMTTVNQINGRNYSFTKGAFDRLIQKCKFINLNGEIRPLNEKILNKLNEISNKLSDKALRVLAFAYKIVENDFSNLENGLIFIGVVGMIDPPREETYDAIKSCFNAGLTPIMITGDHPNTAYQIAKQLGICQNKNQVLTGEMLDNLSENELLDKLLNIRVFARVSPENKVRIVKAFKKQGKIVAMTGDGVNDAPSLKIADIGVGMGITGTDCAKSVSDLIVTDDNFATIVLAVKEGRKVYANIQKTIQFLLSTNIVEVVSMFLAIMLFPNYNYLFPSQMLFINLVTDSLPAFSLGVEKAEDDIMDKKPRKSSATIFSDGVGWNIIYQSVLQTIIVMLVFVWGIKTASNEVASTMVFMIISFMQLFHSINCKSNKSLFKINIFNNKTFNICFISTLILNISVFTLPVFRELFNIAKLNLSQWLVVIIASISIIPFVEIAKLIITIIKKLRKKSKKVNVN